MQNSKVFLLKAGLGLLAGLGSAYLAACYISGALIESELADTDQYLTQADDKIFAVLKTVYKTVHLGLFNREEILHLKSACWVKPQLIRLSIPACRSFLCPA